MNNTTDDKNDMCAAVAFYGIAAPQKSVDQLYNHVVKWFAKAGHSPNRMGVDAPNFSGKIGSFTSQARRLERQGFEKMNALTIIADQNPRMNRCFIEAHWSLEYGTYVISALTSVSTLDDDFYLPMVQELVGFMKPEYGTGYCRPQHLGPVYYSLGMNYGTPETDDPVEDEKQIAITRWLDAMERKPWRKGILRDVYPWNFLGPEHLTRNIGKQTLENWIKQEAGRGTLEAVGNLTLWKIDQADISPARKELHKAGILFDWRRDLPEFAAPASPFDIKKFFNL